MAVRRARAGRPRRQQGARPGHLGHHRRAGRRQGPALHRRLPAVHEQLGRLHLAPPIGGVFYGGLIAAVVVCIYQLRKHQLPLWTSGDLFAPGIALGYMVGRLGCLMAGCCFGQADRRGLGDHVHRPGRQPQRRHAAQRAAAPDASLRVARRPGDLPGPAAARAPRPGVSRAGRSGCSSCSTRCHGSSSSSIAAMIAGSCSTWSRRPRSISVVLVPLSLFMLWYLGRPERPAAPRDAAAPREAAVCVRVNDAVRCSRCRSRPRANGWIAISRGEIPNHSRSQIQRLIDEGHVVVPRVKRTKANVQLREGDTVEVTLPDASASTVGGSGHPARHPLRRPRYRRRQQAGRHGGPSRGWHS